MSVRMLAESTPVARLPHLCQLCRRHIDSGERYYLARCADDGPPYSWRAHERCRDLEPRYWSDVYGIARRDLDEYDTPDVAEFRDFIDKAVES